jgi:hypothetical protein
MNRNLLLLPLIAAVVVTGCSMRQTTTDRTAVEQALLSVAATRTLEKMDFSSLTGKTFFIKEDKFEAVDGKFVSGELRAHLLKQGLIAAEKEEDTDLLVWPRVASHGIDDSKFLIGLPPIPIPVPTVGVIETPEIAIFKLDRQRGRNRMGVHIEESETGKLALATNQVSAQSRYDRWVILILFGWTNSDLDVPWSSSRLGNPFVN